MLDCVVYVCEVSFVVDYIFLVIVNNIHRSNKNRKFLTYRKLLIKLLFFYYGESLSETLRALIIIRISFEPDSLACTSYQMWNML